MLLIKIVLLKVGSSLHILKEQESNNNFLSSFTRVSKKIRQF